MIFKCPGSQRFSQPEPEIINCSYCGAEVEMFSDEAKATCPKCAKTVTRENAASCLDWCSYAKECVGGRVYDKYMKNKVRTWKARFFDELKKHFEDDERRVEHAEKVADFAEKILKQGKGDWHIVVPAALLHDVGIKEAEKKYGSLAGKYQEKEGPAIAGRILMELGFRKEYIEEICDIIGHHHTPGEDESDNYKVLYDADTLVNLKEAAAEIGRERLAGAIESKFLTAPGKELAKKAYL